MHVSHLKKQKNRKNQKIVYIKFQSDITWLSWVLRLCAIQVSQFVPVPDVSQSHAHEKNK